MLLHLDFTALSCRDLKKFLKMWSQQVPEPTGDAAIQQPSSGTVNYSEQAFEDGESVSASGDIFPVSPDAESTSADGSVINLREPAGEPELSYREWLRTKVLRSRALVYFSAFYVHWLVVLILAVIIIHGPDTFSAISLVATVADSGEQLADLPILIDTEIEMSVDVLPKPEPVASQVASVLPSEQPLSDLQMADSLLREFARQQEGESSKASNRQFRAADKEVKHPANTPVQAVVSGSFAVWTEPANPQPGQPYRIFIQIRLPEGTRLYDLSDLDGVVVGTDGYRKPIPGYRHGRLPVDNGCVRIIVPVVCADEKVKDVVYVRSRLLKETQQLTIEF